MAADIFDGGILLNRDIGFAPRPIVDRTEMETGPVKQRRRQTRTMVERPDVKYILTAAEFEGFLDWYYNDIGYGSLWFDWDDPITTPATSREVRMVSGQFTARPVNAHGTHHEVTFTLEHYSE